MTVHLFSNSTRFSLIIHVYICRFSGQLSMFILKKITNIILHNDIYVLFFLSRLLTHFALILRNLYFLSVREMSLILVELLYSL